MGTLPSFKQLLVQVGLDPVSVASIVIVWARKARKILSNVSVDCKKVDK